jgi:rubrerythrin
MANLTNPFTCLIPEKKLSNIELIQAIRQDIASEMEAQFLYEAHIAATDNELAKKVFKDILEEEKIHVGQLTSLLEQLDPTFIKQNNKGKEETEDLLNNKNKSDKSPYI